MTCREMVKFLMDYLTGELPGTTRARFEEHLAECPDCVNYLQTYQQAIRLGKVAGDDDAPTEMPEELVRAILNSRPKST